MINEVVNAGSHLKMKSLECYAKESPEIRRAENKSAVILGKNDVPLSFVPFS